MKVDNVTHPRNGMTSCTSSVWEITSWLKSWRHRRKLSYASGLRMAFRTCRRRFQSLPEATNHTCMWTAETCSTPRLTFSKNMVSVLVLCLLISDMQCSFPRILGFFCKSVQNIIRIWITCFCAVMFAKLRVRIQVHTLTGGVGACPEGLLTGRPFWLSRCLLFTRGLFTVPPWSLRTESARSAAALPSSCEETNKVLQTTKEM